MKIRVRIMSALVLMTIMIVSNTSYGNEMSKLNEIEKNRRISMDVKGDMIIINKSTNTLYFFKNDKLHKVYPVATGKTASLTPDGKFKVVVKYKNPAWGGAGISPPIPGGAPNNPLGKRWIGISYGGGNKYGIHGNSNPKSIGTYASLGCVRMFNEDVEKLYEIVKINTPVWIGPEEKLMEYGIKFDYKDKEIEQKEDDKQEKVNIIINEYKVDLPVSAIRKNETLYYPFREILELIGAKVSWDGENKKIKGTLDGRYIEFQLNNNEYKMNDKYRFLPEGQRIFIKEDKTYLPIGNFLEGLGYDVDWDEETMSILINEKEWTIGEN